MKRIIACRGAIAWAAAGFVGLHAAPSLADAPPLALAAEPTVEDLQSLSIEDLANVPVTSVSRHPVALGEASAAIYVITAEDIRRSGATSLPEVLRLAPNLEVARLNSYSWTVTARGFNSPETANKLLVMVNGRSVYEPIGGGVLWQQVDVDLANISRIEVISGPGGTMWGANAVNGVINVITKDAASTQGFYAQATAGTFERAASVRFGGRINDHLGFKLIGNVFDTDATDAATPDDTTDDAFHGAFVSASLTGTWSRDSWAAGIASYNNRISDDGAKFTGTLARLIWSRDLGNGSGFNVSAVVSRDIRDEPTLYESRDSVVLSAQHNIGAGERHQIVWGGEYRYWWENFNSYSLAFFADPKTNISLGSLFIQDEIALRPDLKLTLGLKAETNSYSGFNWLPNLRLAWQADPDNMLWAAVSEAVRTPNRIERELQADGLILPSPDFGPEKLTAFEAGWRGQPSQHVSLSLSAFYNVYDDLRTWGYPETIFPIMLQNGARGTTYGLEGWGRYEVRPGWRLSAGFNLLHKDFELKPGYNDLAALVVQGQDPGYQAQLRSEWNITSTVEFDLALRRVGEIDTAPVPAYTEMDAHLGWRLNDTLQLAIDGSNLLNARHLEVWDPSTAKPRYIPRSVRVSLRYGF